MEFNSRTKILVSTYPSKIVAILIILVFGMLSSSRIMAAETAPQWRQNGGEKVLLAATSNKNKKSKRRSIRRPGRDFDHLLTGFPLFGAHTIADCGDCHLRGILRGTPTRCEQCHGMPGQRASSFKPMNHINTREPCDQCHNENIFSGANFDHSAIAPGTCTQCHNGSKAMDKPAGHTSTTLACDSCHRTTGWIPAHFKHGTVTPGTCETCHGVTATGKPGGHVGTTDSCDVCHTTRGWTPALYADHSGVTPGTCSNCHGVWATGKPGGHIPAPMSCDECHNTNSFSNSTMDDHNVIQGVVPGGCLTCHNGAYKSQGARGLPGDHDPSAVSTCDGSGCHSTNTWDN